MTGLYQSKQWYGEERPVDFYDMKGAVEALLKALGLRDFSFERRSAPPWYLPELTAAVLVRGLPLGHVGRLRSDVSRRFGVNGQSLFLFELDMGILLEKTREDKHFEPVPKFPAVYRDISLVLDRHTESAKIQDIIKTQGGELVESATLFDHYEGDNMDPSEKAVAFRVCYRSKRGTLDGKEINKLHEAIIEKIAQETGGRLREG
jgi:phenylalanyl-tRNA synthetase beta chain